MSYIIIEMDDTVTEHPITDVEVRLAGLPGFVGFVGRVDWQLSGIRSSMRSLTEEFARLAKIVEGTK